MTRQRITELPYYKDSVRLFEVIADQPWAVFLDSAQPVSRQGRYDILSANPAVKLITRGGMTEVHGRDSVQLSPEDPFELIKQYLTPFAESGSTLPFSGGAMGYFGYDLGRRLERLPSLAEDDEQLPQMAVGIYDWAVVVDHRLKQSWLAGHASDQITETQWQSLVQRFHSPRSPRKRTRFRVTGRVASNLDKRQYASAYRRVKRYIREGDCYQVNLAQRFSVAVKGDPWLAYQALRKCNPAPFSAYLNLPHAQIMSASPERFLRVLNGNVETQPVKGTSPRCKDPTLDQECTAALAVSEKDRAENVMIVDLLRNDLSKNCALGSVNVPRLFEVQTFATVHHLVSTITGNLAAGRDGLDLLKGCFPGGSITGAPKLRAMEIIEELEPHRRGVYCGSIAYIGFDGSMDSNIAIRTLVRQGDRITFWAGGGIVADSSLEGEYQESFDKAATMLDMMTEYSKVKLPKNTGN